VKIALDLLGRSHEPTVACDRIKMLPVSFSGSPASAPRYTLPKLNLKTQLGAKTLRVRKTTTIPIRQVASLFFSQACKVDLTQNLREQP
jgi:hypothetical protein